MSSFTFRVGLWKPAEGFRKGWAEEQEGLVPQSLEQEMTGGRGTGEQEVGTDYGKQIQKEWGLPRCGDGEWGAYNTLCLLALR